MWPDEGRNWASTTEGKTTWSDKSSCKPFKGSSSVVLQSHISCSPKTRDSGRLSAGFASCLFCHESTHLPWTFLNWINLAHSKGVHASSLVVARKLRRSSSSSS